MASHPFYAVRDYDAFVGTDVFSVPFPFISRAHVLVWVDDNPVNFTWLTDSTIKLDKPLTKNSKVRLKRRTPLDYRVVDFQSANILTERDLDASALQTFYIQQETQDDLELGLIGNPNAVPVKGDKGDYIEHRYQWALTRPDQPDDFDPQPAGWTTDMGDKPATGFHLYMVKCLKDGELGTCVTNWTSALRLTGDDGYGANPDAPEWPYDVLISASDTAVIITWGTPNFEGYLDTKIYRMTWDGESPYVFNENFAYSSGIGNYMDTNVEAGQWYVYWLRHFNTKGEASDYSAALPVRVRTPLDLREGWIGQEQLRADLASRIELIDLPDVGLIDKVGRLEEVAGRLELEAGSYVTTEAIQAEDYAKRTDLTGYVLTTDLNTQLSSYVTTETFANADYASKTDLTAYVLSDDLTTTLSSFVTTTALANADYASKSELVGYVTKTDLDTQLDSYVSSEALAGADYASKTDLTAYVLSTDLATTLSSYVTTETFANADYASKTDLTAYAKTIDVQTELSSYVTQTSLANADYVTSTALTGYVLESELTGRLSNYVTTTEFANADYALKSELTAYVSTATLGTTLESYVSNTELANKDFATNTSLTAYKNTADGRISAVEQKAEANANEAYYSVKVDRDGKVAGFGLVSNPEGTAILFSADQIGFQNDAGSPILPFSVRNGIVYMDNARVSLLEANSIVNIDDVDGNEKRAHLGNTFIEGRLAIGKAGQILWKDLDPEFRDRLVMRSSDSVLKGGTRVSTTKMIDFDVATLFYACRDGDLANPPIESGGRSCQLTVNIQHHHRGWVELDPPYIFYTAHRKNINTGAVDNLGSGIHTGTTFWDEGNMFVTKMDFVKVFTCPLPTAGHSYEYYIKLADKRVLYAGATCTVEAREEVSSSDNLVVNTDWELIQNKPAMATRWASWSEVTGKPSTYTPSSHTHAWSQITGAPATATRWPTPAEVGAVSASALDTAGITAAGGAPFSDVWGKGLKGFRTGRAYNEPDMPEPQSIDIFRYLHMGDGVRDVVIAIGNRHNDGSLGRFYSRSLGDADSGWIRHFTTKDKPAWGDIEGQSINDWGGLRHSTSHGYIDFGPANTSYAHIYTDMPSFYFNKPLYENGGGRVFSTKHLPSWGEVTGKPETATRWPSWSEVTDKPIVTEQDRASGTVSTTGWYTIAEGSARTYGRFTLSDATSGRHNIVTIIAAGAYGKLSVQSIDGLAYGTLTIRHVRILYNTADRTYGTYKLQVYCTSPTFALSTVQHKDAANVNGWTNWTLKGAVLENTPSGYAEDATARIDDVTGADGRSVLSKLYVQQDLFSKGHKVLTYGDLRPDTPPPAGLENSISASWLTAGVVQANLIASGGLNVSSGSGSSRRTFTFQPAAKRPMHFFQGDLGTTSQKDLFYVDAEGGGYFKGGLAPNSVDAQAIDVSAKQAIYPHYLSDGEKYVNDSLSQLRGSGAAQYTSGFTTLVKGDKVNIRARVSDNYSTIGNTTKYTNSTYTLQVQRQHGSSSGSWSNIGSPVTVVNNGWWHDSYVEYDDRYDERPEEIRYPARSGYYYNGEIAVTDTLNVTSGYVRYRVLVTRTASGTGTTSGLTFRYLGAVKSSFKSNELKSSSGVYQHIDKETGFVIITAKHSFGTTWGSKYFSFPQKLTEVYGCTLGVDWGSDVDGRRIQPRYRSLTTSGVYVHNAEEGVATNVVTITVTGRIAV